MLKKNTGYILAAIGVLGFGFFRYYKGHVIQYATLWFIVSIVIGVVGLWLVYISRSATISKQEKYTRERVGKLKQIGEEIMLTVDNCEIKENNYYEEVIPGSSSKAQQLDALYDANRNYKQNYIERSAIIYYYLSGGKKIRMTSQSFPYNAGTLTNYVDNKKVSLFVNRFDKNDYEFEISA